MSVFFSSVPFESFRSEFSDSEESNDLECYICKEPLESQETIEGHEGFGRTRHAIHRVCLELDVQRQDQVGRQAAQCNMCAKNILNSDSYLPWRSRIKKRVREFADRNKTLTGVALGAISILGGMVMAQAGGLPDDFAEGMKISDWPLSERIKILPAMVGSMCIPAISMVFSTNRLSLSTINSEGFLLGAGAAVAAAIATNGWGWHALLPAFGIASGLNIARQARNF